MMDWPLCTMQESTFKKENNQGNSWKEKRAWEEKFESEFLSAYPRVGKCPILEVVILQSNPTVIKENLNGTLAVKLHWPEIGAIANKGHYSD